MPCLMAIWIEKGFRSYGRILAVLLIGALLGAGSAYTVLSSQIRTLQEQASSLSFERDSLRNQLARLRPVG